MLLRAVSSWVLRIWRDGDCILWAYWASIWPPCEWKGVSLCSSRISRVSVCTHCLLSTHWAPLSLAWQSSPLLHPPAPFRHLIQTDQFLPQSLLFSRLNSLSSLSLSSYVRCSSPFIIFVAHGWTCSWMSMSLVLGSPQLNTLNCTLKWLSWKCEYSVQTNPKSCSSERWKQITDLWLI